MADKCGGAVLLREINRYNCVALKAVTAIIKRSSLLPYRYSLYCYDCLNDYAFREKQMISG